MYNDNNGKQSNIISVAQQLVSVYGVMCHQWHQQPLWCASNSLSAAAIRSYLAILHLVDIFDVILASKGLKHHKYADLEY